MYCVARTVCAAHRPCHDCAQARLAANNRGNASAHTLARLCLAWRSCLSTTAAVRASTLSCVCTKKDSAHHRGDVSAQVQHSAPEIACYCTHASFCSSLYTRFGANKLLSSESWSCNGARKYRYCQFLYNRNVLAGIVRLVLHTHSFVVL